MSELSLSSQFSLDRFFFFPRLSLPWRIGTPLSVNAEDVWGRGLMSCLRWLSATLVAFLGHAPFCLNAQADEREMLEALGYVDSAPVQADTHDLLGVVNHDPTRAHPGINVVIDRKAKTVSLLDMTGETLHTWRSPIRKNVRLDYALILKDGSVLVLHTDHSILRLRWDGSVMWGFEARAHHEIVLDGQGGFYTLLRREEVRGMGGLGLPSLVDYIAHYSLEGMFLGGIDLFPLYAPFIDKVTIEKSASLAEEEGFWRWWRDPNRGVWAQFIEQDSPLDHCHTNSIWVLPQDIEGAGKKGDLLISYRNVGVLGILDLETRTHSWTWGRGELVRQHHGTVFDGQRILVFDNGNAERPYSRVLAVTPGTGAFEVVYQDEPRESFYSYWGGSAQHLPNGNTLSWDAHHGHGVETTVDGEVVWEFYNAFANAKKTDRKALYRLERVVDPGTLGTLERLLKSSGRSDGAPAASRAP